MTRPPPAPPPPGEASMELNAPDSSVHGVPVILLQPASQRKHHHQSKPTRVLRSMRSAFRALPILPAASGCHMPAASPYHRRATRTTVTLFGHRKSRITLAFQDTPRSVPHLLLELAVPTDRFMQDMGSSTDLFRVALECEKRAGAGAGPARSCVLDEPVWAAFVNGRSVGYAARRDATEMDLSVMRLLHAVSMGAGMLPGDMADAADGELTYMRAYFDRVAGSKDSETFYMLNPDGNVWPELSIFFVRI